MRKNGLAEHWGRGVFKCPYCDGWEHRGQPLAVLGADIVNVLLALNLVRWSPDVVLCANGGAVEGDSLRLLAARGMTVRAEPVRAVEGNSTVPGVFAIGDMARRPSMPLPGALVVIGAAEGAIAAVAIDQEFLFETLA